MRAARPAGRRSLGAGLIAMLLSLGCGGTGGSASAAGEATIAGETGAPDRKRAAPEPVAPLTHRGVRYEVVHWGKARGLEQNGGYLAAVDPASGEELWLVRVYEIAYGDDLEPDKQDVFITRLQLACAGGCLEIRNERGEQFRVDLASRTVERREG